MTAPRRILLSLDAHYSFVSGFEEASALRRPAEWQLQRRWDVRHANSAVYAGRDFAVPEVFSRWGSGVLITGVDEI